MFIIHTYVTGPGKTGLIYTKYTCLYYSMYLLLCMCYPHSVNFIEFLMDFCIYDNILDTIQIIDKKLLHFKLLKSGQILHPVHYPTRDLLRRLVKAGSYNLHYHTNDLNAEKKSQPSSDLNPRQHAI